MCRTLFLVIVSHCLLKLTMYFPVSRVLFLFMFCTSMNIFWLLVVSSGRAWPFSADSLHFWNPSCFHAAVWWQSQSLCLLGEWCKAHLLAQADRKKAAFKEGLWVACFFQSVREFFRCCPEFFNVHVWRVNLQKQHEWSFPTGSSSEVLLWLFSPCIQAFSSRFRTQRKIFQRKLSHSFSFKHISDACSFTCFRLVTFLQIFSLFL